MATVIDTRDTFPKLLMHHAQVRGERPAIREKDLGIWQTWTWKQFADEARYLACGLAGAFFARQETRPLTAGITSFSEESSSSRS